MQCPDVGQPARIPMEVSLLREPLIEQLVTKLELLWEDAAVTVDHLIRAEQAGKSDHGLIRIPYLLSSGKFGPYGNLPAPVPQKSGPGHIHIEGANHLGYSAMHNLVDSACLEVEHNRFCIATSAGLYPSGALGDWSSMATSRGVASVVVASSPPRVAPPDGVTPIVGTNPISIGIPTEPIPFISDSATSEITHGLLLLARTTGKPLPLHAAVGKDGNPAIYAEDVDPAQGKGAFLPAGGSHKAFALAMGIELLVGLGGCLPGRNQQKDYGVFGLFLSPRIFHVDVLSAMSDWLSRLDQERVRIPGWTSHRRAIAQQDQGIVEIFPDTLKLLETWMA